MEVGDLIRWLRESDDVPVSVEGQHSTPARPARYAPYPDWIHAGLQEALEARGITELYRHQRGAADALIRVRKCTR